MSIFSNIKTKLRSRKRTRINLHQPAKEIFKYFPKFCNIDKYKDISEFYKKELDINSKTIHSYMDNVKEDDYIEMDSLSRVIDFKGEYHKVEYQECDIDGIHRFLPCAVYKSVNMSPKNKLQYMFRIRWLSTSPVNGYLTYIISDCVGITHNDINNIVEIIEIINIYSKYTY